MLADLTISTPSWVGIVFMAAVGLLVFVLWPSSGKNKKTKQVALVAAAVVACGGIWYTGVGKGPSDPAPSPTPSPDPTPVPPTPGPSDFGSRVKASFTGTPAEAALLSAMFGQMADSIQWDQTRPTPLLKTTTDIGKTFNELQRYRVLGETQWGVKFQPLERTIAAEMQARGIYSPGQSVQLTPDIRSKFVDLNREIASALATIQ